MKVNEYQTLAMRTKGDYNSNLDQLTCAALGLIGEGGEVADLIKKVRYQGHDYDKAKIIGELGDVAWYMALAADALGVSLRVILEDNVEKLRKRYPDGFEVKRSTGREEY